MSRSRDACRGRMYIARVSTDDTAMALDGCAAYKGADTWVTAEVLHQPVHGDKRLCSSRAELAPSAAAVRLA